MPTPGEHKTVQARILEYAEAIGWTFVSREEAERRRGIARDQRTEVGSQKGSLFFDDLLDAKVRGVGHGPHLARGELAAKRDSFGEVVLVGRLNPALSVADAASKLEFNV